MFAFSVPALVDADTGPSVLLQAASPNANMAAPIAERRDMTVIGFPPRRILEA